MKKTLRMTWPVATAAVFMVLGLTTPFWAGNPSGTPVNQKSSDQLYETLRVVINKGADVFNPPVSDYNGCYRIYQGSLLSVRPMLADHADLQKKIDDALALTDAMPSSVDKAFALRKVLDEIRAKINPNPTPPTTVKDGGKDKGKPDPKKDQGTPKVDPSKDKTAPPKDGKVDPKKDKTAPPKVDPKKDKTAPPKDGKVDPKKDKTAPPKVDPSKDKTAPPKVDPSKDKTAPPKDGKVEPKKGTGDAEPQEQPAGKVLGNLTIQGKPAGPAEVSLVSAKNNTVYHTTISANGAYAFATPIEVGSYRITVTPAVDPVSNQPIPNAPAIPEQFRSADTSGLTITVTPGNNNFNIALR